MQKVPFQSCIPLETTIKKKRYVPLSCILLSLTILIYTWSHTACWKPMPLSPNGTAQVWVHLQRPLSSTAWVHGWKNKLPLWPALLIDHKISPSSTTDIMPFALLASPKKEKLILGVFQQWKLFHMTASAHAAPGCLLQAAQEQLPFLLFSLRQVNTFSSVATKCLDGCREFLDVKLLGIFCNSSKHGGWGWWTLTFLSLIGK